MSKRYGSMHDLESDVMFILDTSIKIFPADYPIHINARAIKVRTKAISIPRDVMKLIP